MKPILVTGCGRSGTLYTATLLQMLGLPCRHERAFKPPMNGLPSWEGIEVAWEAAPYVERLAPCMMEHLKDVMVIHQLRDPMMVIRSFLRDGFFGRDDDYRQHIYKFLPHLEGLSEVEQAMAYWVEWNEFVVRPHCRCLIDRVDWKDWRGMLLMIGINIDKPEIEGALALPKNINTTGLPQEGEHTWKTLPQGRLLERLRKAARRYGYL